MSVSSCTVPGKIMLAGEYAVLDGAPALACTVDRALTARVAPRATAGARVRSTLWSEAREVAPASAGVTTPSPLEDTVAFALTRYGLHGADVDVDSDIDVTHGIGSSSALRLGVLLASQALAGRGDDDAARWDAARDAYALQRHAQSRASGYDVATQLLGGLVRFRAVSADAPAWPAEARRLDDDAFAGLARLVHPFVGGAGAPTAPLMTGTLAWLAATGRAPALRAASDALVAAFEAALAAPDDAALSGALAAAVQRHRAVLDDAPGFPRALAQTLAALPGEGLTWSFKTTGAGGEDALLLIGPDAAVAPARDALAQLGWTPLAARFTRGGATVRVEAQAAGAPT